MVMFCFHCAGCTKKETNGKPFISFNGKLRSKSPRKCIKKCFESVEKNYREIQNSFKKRPREVQNRVKECPREVQSRIEKRSREIENCRTQTRRQSQRLAPPCRVKPSSQEHLPFVQHAHKHSLAILIFCLLPFSSYEYHLALPFPLLFTSPFLLAVVLGTVVLALPVGLCVCVVVGAERKSESPIAGTPASCGAGVADVESSGIVKCEQVDVEETCPAATAANEIPGYGEQHSTKREFAVPDLGLCVGQR